MRLKDCEIRPGKVLEVCDNYGTIKASCIGVFSETDDPSLLPPITQFIRISNTSFSTPHVGDAVWIWFNHENPLELMYTFKGDANVHNSGILDQNQADNEVLTNRNDGEALLMFGDQEGWQMINKDTGVGIDAENKAYITQNNGKHKLEVSDDGFKFITDGGTQEPAVLGTKLTECLQSLINGLQNAASIGKSNPYTMGMSVAIESALMEFNQKLNQILSKNTTLD